MTAEPAQLDTETVIGGRERRCIVTGDVLPDATLIRFAVGPDNVVVPDVAAKLPGRGMWVSARRDILEQAISRGHFSRAAKAQVFAPEVLPLRVEALLVARMGGDLGMARRSGGLVLGFEAIAEALRSARRPAVLVEASDGAEDGKRKLRALAKPAALRVIDCLTSAELSLALGRVNVVHAALKSGQLSERLLVDAGRLRGFRPASGRGHTASVVGQEPAGTIGQE
jgi:hypothetical protein